MLPPIEAVSNVSFQVVGADLQVTFDLEADGVLATNYDSMQRGYRTDGATRTNICGNASRSDPCDPAQLTLTNNGGGNYTVTVIGGAADAGTDSRYLFRQFRESISASVSFSLPSSVSMTKAVPSGAIHTR